MRQFFRLIVLACLLVPATLAAKKTETVINVIPYPQSVEIGKGTFKAAARALPLSTRYFSLP